MGIELELIDRALQQLYEVMAGKYKRLKELEAEVKSGGKNCYFDIKNLKYELSELVSIYEDLETRKRNLGDGLKKVRQR